MLHQTIRHKQNEDIKFSAFLQSSPSSGTLKVERLENPIISKILESKKSRGPTQDSHIQIRSPIPGGILSFNNNYII